MGDSEVPIRIIESVGKITSDDIELGDRVYAETEKAIRDVEQLPEVSGLRTGQVIGFAPEIGEFASSGVPYCVPDSIVYALQAGGLTLVQITDALRNNSGTIPTDNLQASLSHYLFQIGLAAEKVHDPNASCLSLVSGGQKILNKFFNSNLIENVFAARGNMAEVYQKLLAGQKGVMVLPAPAESGVVSHAVALVGAVQQGPFIEGSIIFVADPLHLFQQATEVTPTGWSEHFTYGGEQAAVIPVPLANFINMQYDTALSLFPGQLNIRLFDIKKPAPITSV